ncbi:hypothetical protein KV102_00385 [Mumia sp. zg.B53]|uniref:hypothetical protein n=1 Tax=Mumia sp. zg.B53 TaxID=2855449 RepID=UPI001C6EA847|nr:hypothetical protein [Mumia sp. zg.B53]MBW9213282.1 hypothetical protein [Mumia sp. zg.B53]
MSASDDWVYASDVIGTARVMAASLPLDLADLRDLCVGVIARLVAGGLIELGDVRSGQGFVRWDATDGEAIVRVARDWGSRRDVDVMPGDLFWLNTTPRGDEIGNAITDWVNADPETRGPAPSVDPAR